ncbi:EH domain-containing protein 1-like 2 [Homarus americanus]|uniref:EH domain-containing protein 1-like 2 n=1 Tax=Homarus americanus TaxID=6706 RepID=A0A8J5MK82_HOMAM|nr:EH domain-containing protein 1-like 2 [Homarus americanus]
MILYPQDQLQHHDFTKFNVMKPRLLEAVDRMLAEDIARLMAMIPVEEAASNKENAVIRGGAFDGVMNDSTVFGFKRGEGADAGAGDPDWIVAKDRFKYDQLFDNLNPVDGKITGSAAKHEMLKSKLPNSVLGKVWKMSDIDKDGMLDADEFALAMHLINIKLDGNDLPNDLPEHLVPPSKRGFQA